MPVFINEVVFRGEVQPGADAGEPAVGDAGPKLDARAMDRLIAKVTEAVLDELERRLDRVGER